MTLQEFIDAFTVERQERFGGWVTYQGNLSDTRDVDAFIPDGFCKRDLQHMPDRRMWSSDTDSTIIYQVNDAVIVSKHETSYTYCVEIKISVRLLSLPERRALRAILVGGTG